MSQDILSLSSMLQRGKKRPDQVFYFYRPDPDLVDQALVLDFHPRDEMAGGNPRDWGIARTTRICSCSSKTLDRWNRIADALSMYQHLQTLELRKQASAQERGEAYKPQPVPRPPDADGVALEILTARVIGEGVLDWDPAPTAVVAVPALGLKRGDPFPLPSTFLPDDPNAYEAQPNEKLVALLRALPNRYFQKVAMCIAWTSNLDVMRFFPDESEVQEDRAKPVEQREGLEAPPGTKEEAGKPSGSPSRGPSSAPATASASDPDSERDDG